MTCGPKRKREPGTVSRVRLSVQTGRIEALRASVGLGLRKAVGRQFQGLAAANPTTMEEPGSLGFRPQPPVDKFQRGAANEVIVFVQLF